MANYGLSLVEYISTQNKIKAACQTSKTQLYITSCLFVEKMFLLQNLLSHRLVHSRSQLRTQRAVPSPEVCREQHTMPTPRCLPAQNNVHGSEDTILVLRWLLFLLPLLPLTPRGYPQSSANCSLERSPHIHSFTYHPLT